MIRIKDIKDIPEDLLGNFHEGETVILDKGSLNQCLVTIKEFNKKFVLVEDQHGQRYPVMIYRLSKS